MSPDLLVYVLPAVSAGIGAWVAVRVKLAQIEATATRALGEADRANRRIDRHMERA